VFFLKFLLDAVNETDHVTRSFIEHMVPKLMQNYVDTSAKGGEHSDAKDRKFEEKDDQNMVSHQLNGLFPTLRLLNIVESEGVGPGPFSEVERRVYILAYLMHDIDKIVRDNTGLKGVATQDREAIEQAKSIIAAELQRCDVADFLPDFDAYVEDITYLVVNTQQKWGTNLHTYLWRFQLPERRLQILRRLCTYSDHIAYLISSPSAILLESGARELTTILNQMSDDSLVFTYHQLREVRGLFTNTVNDAVVELFTEERDGIWPYLFFSNGVVYIQRKSLAINLSTEQIVEKVREQLRQVCAERIKDNAPGFKFSIQGIAKHPGYYFEFLTLEEYAQLLARFTIARTASDITAIPLTKLRQMQESGEIPPNLAMDFAPDKHIGMLSRFLSVIFTTVLDLLDKKQASLRERVEQEVIQHLGLAPYWSQSLTIPNKGGVEYRWFWLAACYKHDHESEGINAYDGENSLLHVFTSTLDRVIALAGDELRQHMPQRYLNHLTRYLESMIELPASVRDEGMIPDFHGEFARYIGAKDKGRKLLCTLCNSDYPTEEQTDNAVLFQPWVYKNKLSLYAGKNAGGVCAICALELMLRQILQKGLIRLTGSKFEALKTKYLTVYPNFFFTKETGALVHGVLDQLQDVNFFTIRRQLEGKDITLASLMQLDVFAAAGNEILQPKVLSFHEESDDDEVGETGEEVNEDKEAEETSKSSAERSYIKFQQPGYPGAYLFGMKAGKDDDDTSSWAMPAFLALALPLVTNTKVVLSEVPLPLFASGYDFRETVVIDAPHAYLTRLLRGNRIRINKQLAKLSLLTSIYRVNLDTYARQGKPEWKHLSGITRDLTTDPLYLFSYLRKQQRDEQRDALRSDRVTDYLHIYESILEEDLSKIKDCVDLYTKFYHGGFESHSILKPVDIVAKAIINSPMNIEPDDLLWQIQGELKNWLDRVRSRQATGRAMFWGRDIDAKEMPALRAFVEYFYHEVFVNYCQGERGILRSRLNRFKDGCEAYYVSWRASQRIQEQPEQDIEEVTEAVEI